MDSENGKRKDDIYSITCFSVFPFSSCKRKKENMYNGSYFYFSFFVCGLRKKKRILRYHFTIFYHEIENEKRKDGIYTDLAVTQSFHTDESLTVEWQIMCFSSDEDLLIMLIRIGSHLLSTLPTRNGITFGEQRLYMCIWRQRTNVLIRNKQYYTN